MAMVCLTEIVQEEPVANGVRVQIGQGTLP
jgi:hypothetical protein